MKMKKIFKWVGIVIGSLLIIGFFAFLYFIPPFTIAPPEEFSAPEAAAPPSLENISDPAERAIAKHGEQIVLQTSCTGCHTAQGEKGPQWDRYLAGGFQLVGRGHGLFVTRNLTPDPTTGIARRSDDQVKRVLRSGVLNDGRQAFYRLMPWSEFSNWTEEDLHAVVVFLRHLKPIHGEIPEPDFKATVTDPTAIEQYYGVDLAKH